MDCSLPGSYVHGILQARILEWVAILFSKGSSQPRDRTWVSCITGRFFTIWTTREAHHNREQTYHGTQCTVSTWLLLLFFFLIFIYLFCSIWSQLRHTGSFIPCAGFSLVAACGLSCPAACEILVPQPGMEPMSPALKGGFLTTGPPKKSLLLNPSERVSGTWTLTHPKLKLVFKVAEGLAGLCSWGYNNVQVR